MGAIIMNDKKLESLHGFLKAELSPEQLGVVSGGTYTPEQAQQLQDVLKAAKSAGMSQQDVLNMVPTYFGLLSSQYPDVTLDEVTGFINNQWANL